MKPWTISTVVHWPNQPTNQATYQPANKCLSIPKTNDITSNPIKITAKWTVCLVGWRIGWLIKMMIMIMMVQFVMVTNITMMLIIWLIFYGRAIGSWKSIWNNNFFRCPHSINFITSFLEETNDQLIIISSRGMLLAQIFAQVLTEQFLIAEAFRVSDILGDVWCWRWKNCIRKWRNGKTSVNICFLRTGVPFCCITVIGPYELGTQLFVLAMHWDRLNFLGLIFFIDWWVPNLLWVVLTTRVWYWRFRR